ncbi:restriction endonuclease subunit S [Castellaniella sp. MT123]|uniref:restriction endonuclease subunit S n=1 Tax=Castellaniella sp. MT123 TaxID=3140381 RepID=UPI0031F35FA5
MKAWPVVPLADVLQHRKEFVTIDDTSHYKRCRVQLHAKGVLLRDRVSGADIKTKKQQVCQSGEFLVAEIDAKMGGFGLVPTELDGAVVSSHYFLFELDESSLDARYLDHYCRTERFRTQVEAQGSTNYAAIRPADVLTYTIPLPLLAEQQTLVARLDALAEKTRQLEAHLDAALRDAEHLLALRFRDAIADAPLRPIADVAPLVRREVTIDPKKNYTELGVRSFYKGAFHRRTVPGSDFSWQDLYRVQAGDLIFSNIMAWEQAIAIAQAQDDGCVGNHRMLTCEANAELAVPGFLWYYFTTEEGFAKIYAASPGTAARNRTMTAPALMSIEVPTPPLAAQQTFDRLQTEIAALKAKHTAIREANAALLPAMLERVFAQ